MFLKSEVIFFYIYDVNHSSFHMKFEHWSIVEGINVLRWQKNEINLNTVKVVDQGF